MNTGFRGTRLGLRKLALNDSVLSYEVAYVSEDGVVHGLMEHSLMVGAETEIDSKIDELCTLLLKKAAALHFDSPESTNRGELLTGRSHGGLRESLEDPSQASDEPGSAEG